jgi:drug/metabolite transporter (DMT)-like permease
LWVSVASLGVLLAHLPPFLLTGVSLLIGGLLALPQVLRDPRQWRIPLPTLALGIYGLFGYHFMLFMALRLAPAVEANLINYLWPLLMVVLAPVLLKNMQLRAVHLGAALLGFGGAALAILGTGGHTAGLPATGGVGAMGGYLAALAAAFMWSSYSLLTQRVAAFPTAAIGLFALVSGMLSLLCHWALEAPTPLSSRDMLLLGLMGLGPLGGAFFLWDKALKLGDARQIGILSYLTPLGSTALLIVVTGRQWSWSIGLAAGMIMAAAVLGTRAR